MTTLGSHQARRRFGQNFLQDPNIIEKIASAIAAKSQDHLLEIGPGQAAITSSLLESVPSMHAIEIDRDLIAGLQRRFPPEQLQIHEGDALKVEIAHLLPAGL